MAGRTRLLLLSTLGNRSQNLLHLRKLLGRSLGIQWAWDGLGSADYGESNDHIFGCSAYVDAACDEPAVGAEDVDACGSELAPGADQMGTICGSVNSRLTLLTNSASLLESASCPCVKSRLSDTYGYQLPASKTTMGEKEEPGERGGTHEVSLIRRRELEDVRPPPRGLVHFDQRRLAGEQDQVLQQPRRQWDANARQQPTSVPPLRCWLTCFST